MFQLGRLDESETAYSNALAVDAKYRKQPQPWQGLLNVYERKKDVGRYLETVEALGGVFKDA